jgi:hypothetical protein
MRLKGHRRPNAGDTPEETVVRGFTMLQLGMNVEASQISGKGVLEELHLALSGIAQLHYQSSILPKLRVENMHLNSVLDIMSAY